MGRTKIAGMHAHAHQAKRQVSTETNKPNCTHGGITSPSIGATVDSLQPLNVAWNTACLKTDSIDLILYSTHANPPVIYLWQSVNFHRGEYTVNLEPRWWNATSSAGLQIGMTPHGLLSFMSGLSAGPTFTAKYTAPTNGTTPPSADTSSNAAGFTVVNNFDTNKKLTSGRAAAGVLIPLLFIGLGIFAYIRWTRVRTQKERKQWTEKVDKRMSTISVDWKAMSAAGATAAIRGSMAAPGNRNSAFSFGGIRPQSTAVVEESGDDAPRHTRNLSQMRPGVGLRNPVGSGVGYGAQQADRQSRISFAADAANRVSRVSFADGTRPSLDSRKSRAFHSSFVPPMPSNAAAAVAAAAAVNKIPSSGSSEDGTTDSGVMSPRQTAGAVPLSVEDIKSRLGNDVPAPAATAEGIHGGRERYDDMMAALSMVRTHDSPITSDFIFDVPPTPAPAQIYNTGSQRGPSFESAYLSESPRTMSPASLQQALPATMMSPDDMLRFYAEQRKRNSGQPSNEPPTAFPNTMFATATPIQQIRRTSSASSSSPRSSGLLSHFTSPLNPKKRKEKRMTANKFAISGPVINYPSLAAGSGPSSELGAPPVPGDRRGSKEHHDGFGGPMGI